MPIEPTTHQPAAVVATPSPAGRDPDGRRRITDAAADLFLRQGFSETSQRHIATAAGMKAGSLYYHFASKNEILEAILRQGVTVMEEAFESARRSGTDLDGRSRLGAHVRAHLSALFENGPFTAAHIVTFRTAPDGVRDAIVPERDAYESRWTQLLTGLRDTGDLAPDIPIGLCRLNLLGSMNSSLEWFDAERGNLDQLAELLTTQFWRGHGQFTSPGAQQ